MPAQSEESLAVMKELQLEVEQLRRQHGEDQRSLNAALRALYEERNFNPLQGCLPILLWALPGLVYTCVLYGSALAGPLHQGLHDRVAMTVVIEARRRLRRSS